MGVLPGNPGSRRWAARGIIPPMARRHRHRTAKKAIKRKSAPSKHAAVPARAPAFGGFKALPTRPPVGGPDFVGRIRRLMGLGNQQDLDHLLITNPLDVGYLTGFMGGDSYLVLGPAAGPKQALVISDGRYDEELRPFRGLVDVLIRDKSMALATADVLASAHVHRCGIQSDHLTLGESDSISRALGADGSGKLVPTQHLVSKLREVKDAFEAELMQTATRIQEAALLAVLPTIKPGQTEMEIAALLEMEMKRRGSARCWFDSIIGARANGALPHYRPGFTKTAANQPLLIDWGSTFAGYGGDMTRTFCLGKWPAKMREIYEIVREAQETAAAALAPGKRAHQIDRIARDIIERAGYGKEFNHGLGHGLGLSKEPPYLNPLWPDMELVPGHVVTVEPGIYLPGIGGVRIEDLYIITENGARNFCSLPKTLEWSTL